jgi:hypothetical protein
MIHGSAISASGFSREAPDAFAKPVSPLKAEHRGFELTAEKTPKRLHGILHAIVAESSQEIRESGNGIKASNAIVR